MLKLSLNKKPLKPSMIDDPENPTFTPIAEEDVIQKPEAETLREASAPQSSDSSQNEPDHFDDLIGAAEESEAEHTAPPAGYLTREQFIQVYATGFNAASAITGLRSLAIDAAEDRAIEGFGALYDTAYDIELLHFMLKPEGKWLGRCIAMGSLFVPMAAGVSQEMKARKAPQADLTREKTAQPHAKPADGEPDAEQIAALTGNS